MSEREFVRAIVAAVRQGDRDMASPGYQGFFASEMYVENRVFAVLRAAENALPLAEQRWRIRED